jgi:hypothetical protein
MNTPARRNHKSLRGWKPYVFGAAAAAALLATTACQPGAAEGSDSSKSSARPSETASAKPGGASSDAGGDAGTGGGTASSGSTSGGSTGSGSGGKAGSTGSGSGGKAGSTGGGSGGGTAGSGSTGQVGGGTGGKEAIVACSQKQLGVSAVKERDLRHLVLTVQNASDKKCNLYRHPLVRLGAGTKDTSVIKDSDATPGVPVTLAPGQEAYAALLVSRGNMDEYEVKRITLTLQGSRTGSTAGSPIDVPMPADSLYADDGQLVTYWTTASGYALDFIMSK